MSCSRGGAFEQDFKSLILPAHPNGGRAVIVEIRPASGGAVIWLERAIAFGLTHMGIRALPKPLGKAPVDIAAGSGNQGVDCLGDMAVDIADVQRVVVGVGPVLALVHVDCQFLQGAALDEHGFRVEEYANSAFAAGPSR